MGRATFRVGDHRIVLSEGVRWVEPEGDHVIRSLEFDVAAGAPTFEAALSKFIDNLFGFAAYLGDLEDPVENEDEMFHRLAPRVVRVSQELERLLKPPRRRPLISVNLPRRRGSREDVREWDPSSRQPGSHLPSHA
jgi:hypothetical protein